MQKGWNLFNFLDFDNNAYGRMSISQRRSIRKSNLNSKHKHTCNVCNTRTRDANKNPFLSYPFNSPFHFGWRRRRRRRWTAPIMIILIEFLVDYTKNMMTNDLTQYFVGQRKTNERQMYGQSCEIDFQNIYHEKWTKPTCADTK